MSKAKKKLLSITFFEQDGRLDMDTIRYELDGKQYSGKLADGDAGINGYIHGRWLVDEPINSDIQKFLAKLAEGIQFSIDNPEPSEHDKLRAEYRKQLKIRAWERAG